MALLAIAIPILPGKKAEWQAFIDELNGPCKQSFDASRRRLGVHERTFLQSTPQAELVIVTLEGGNPAAAFQQFASADDDFTRWFVQQVKNIHGVDLREPLPGPVPELVVDSQG